jgi:hypothetical protein
MESALSPNTAAFLDYLSGQLQNDGHEDVDPKLAQVGMNATSLPPSAFFQLPETKPDISLLSQSSSVSPVESKAQGPNHIHRSTSASGSEGDAATADHGKGGNGADGLHKRKAGLSHTIEEDDGEDDGKSSRTRAIPRPLLI